MMREPLPRLKLLGSVPRCLPTRPQDKELVESSGKSFGLSSNACELALEREGGDMG